jgi:hypothetical protein
MEVPESEGTLPIVNANQTANWLSSFKNQRIIQLHVLSLGLRVFNIDQLKGNRHVSFYVPYIGIGIRTRSHKFGAAEMTAEKGPTRNLQWGPCRKFARNDSAFPANGSTFTFSTWPFFQQHCWVLSGVDFPSQIWRTAYFSPVRHWPALFLRTRWTRTRSRLRLRQMRPVAIKKRAGMPRFAQGQCSSSALMVYVWGECDGCTMAVRWLYGRHFGYPLSVLTGDARPSYFSELLLLSSFSVMDTNESPATVFKMVASRRQKRTCSELIFIRVTRLKFPHLAYFFFSTCHHRVRQFLSSARVLLESRTRSCNGRVQLMCVSLFTWSIQLISWN